jgi:hypothetical protein
MDDRQSRYAAIPAIHWIRYFKIERADCLVIFLHQKQPYPTAEFLAAGIPRWLRIFDLVAVIFPTTVIGGQGLLGRPRPTNTSPDGSSVPVVSQYALSVTVVASEEFASILAI